MLRAYFCRFHFRRAGRRSHTAGSGGLRQASRSFISCSSSRSHLRTASIRSTSVGAAGRLFDCHAISATSLRLSTGSPCFKLTAMQRARTCLTVPCPLRPPWASLAGKLLKRAGGRGSAAIRQDGGYRWSDIFVGECARPDRQGAVAEFQGHRDREGCHGAA
jgi:hypothetical protein